MTQRDRLKCMFRDRANEWIPLPAILAMGIAQYGARILELRHLGMNIENKGEWVKGQRRTWFKYVPNEKQMEIFSEKT